MFKKIRNVFGKVVQTKCQKSAVLHSLNSEERALIVYLLNAREEQVSIGIKHSSADSLITKRVIKEIGREPENRIRWVSICPKYRESLQRIFYTAGKS